MKKRRILIQCIILVSVILVFMAYWAYRQAREDSVGPEITVTGELLELSVEDPDSVLLQGVTAYDKKDGDVTSSVLVESVYGITDENTVTVTYAAFDRSGNVTKTQRQVRYTDYESPRFTLSRSLTFGGSGHDVLDYVGAEDMIDGDIQRRVHATIVSDNGYMDSVGTHEVQFQVTNSLGDTAKIVLPVEVYSADKYTAELELKQYLLYISKGESFHARTFLKSFTYANETFTLQNTVPEELTLKTTGQVNTQEPGVYPVCYTVSKTIGENTFSGYAVLIVVVEE